MPQPKDSASRLSILIVDDVPAIRRDLRGLLELAGEVEVIGEAADGSEAVQLAPMLRPDVVLLDLEMPRMDGITAAGLIKVRSPRSWLVALTIHATDADRERAALAGIDRFVVKGSTLETIMEAVRDARVCGRQGGTS